MIMIIPGELRMEVKTIFKKYCNNSPFKDAYIKAFIKELIGLK